MGRTPGSGPRRHRPRNQQVRGQQLQPQPAVEGRVTAGATVSPDAIAPLQKLAIATGLAITICHFSRGTSKWNAIEHHQLYCDSP